MPIYGIFRGDRWRPLSRFAMPDIPNELTALRSQCESLRAELRTVAWIWTHAPAAALRAAQRAAKKERSLSESIHSLIAAAQKAMPQRDVSPGEAKELDELIGALGDAGKEIASKVSNRPWLLFQLRQLRERLLI